MQGDLLAPIEYPGGLDGEIAASLTLSIKPFISSARMAFLEEHSHDSKTALFYAPVAFCEREVISTFMISATTAGMKSRGRIIPHCSH